MDAQPPTPTGSPLGDRYLLLRLLGRGGMGEVYEAEDLRLHRHVAVKVLRADLADDPRVLARFRREARTAGSLNHPNIVAVHDVGADGAYLVMELVHGRTLAEVIHAEAPLVPGRAARIAGRVAEALEYAHGRGVVHRDVSPGNVMLTETGEVKVLDFGIAQVDLGSTGPASARGTVAYLAPELERGAGAGPRSDVYALGAVLVELLTGAPPVRGDVRVPAALDEVVRRCLAADPADRFARAGDLADALAHAFGDAAQTRPLPAVRAAWSVRGSTTPVLASAPTLPLPPPARRGPRRWAVALATVMTALAAWIVVLPVWQAMSEQPAPPLPPATVELQAPVEVSGTGRCDGFWNARVDLEWTAAATPAAGFEIYRADRAAGPYRLVQRVRGTATEWSDRRLGLDATYFYVLRAVDGGRHSPLTPPLGGGTPLLCLG
jgi:serine/threonine-protein kinase